MSSGETIRARRRAPDGDKHGQTSPGSPCTLNTRVRGDPPMDTMKALILAGLMTVENHKRRLRGGPIWGRRVNDDPRRGRRFRQAATAVPPVRRSLGHLA